MHRRTVCTAATSLRVVCVCVLAGWVAHFLSAVRSLTCTDAAGIDYDALITMCRTDRPATKDGLVPWVSPVPGRPGASAGTSAGVGASKKPRVARKLEAEAPNENDVPKASKRGAGKAEVRRSSWRHT